MYEASIEAKSGKQTVCYFKDREALLDALPGLINTKDTILVKASHGMGFDKVVEALKLL